MTGNPMIERTAYRFSLLRSWAAARGRLGVVMANPSTADDVDDDNTIRSLMRIADGNGFGSLMVGNVSPFRATDPTDLVGSLRAGKDVFQRPDNDQHLIALARRCNTVVCAWGAIVNRHHALEERAAQVRALLETVTGGRLHCFGRTKEGWPKHPLFLPMTTAIVSFAR